VIDFSHATIIMTSNIGTNLFSRTQMGYQKDLDNADVSHASLLKALKKYFSPEFLNRLDEILIFDHLKNSDIRKIIDILLEASREQLSKEGKQLLIRDDVIQHVIDVGYSKEYGARHISRVLRKALLEKVAHASLEKEWEYARQVVCSMDPDSETNEVMVHLENVAVEAADEDTYIGEISAES